MRSIARFRLVVRYAGVARNVRDPAVSLVAGTRLIFPHDDGAVCHICFVKYTNLCARL